MRWLLVVVLLAGGCVDPAPVVKPVKPATLTVDQAAERFFRDYARDAAAVARNTADKCRRDEFRDITEADDYFNEQTKAARLKANEAFSGVLTKALADEKGKKTSAVTGVYEKVAEGFDRVAPR